MNANSYGIKPADQEKARMLALDLLDPNKYVNEQQICYVARAFLELSTSSNGPKEQLKMPSTQEILLAAGEMKPNELAAVKAVLRWYVSKHNATSRPLRDNHIPGCGCPEDK